jgi:argininosuccinate lyase
MMQPAPLDPETWQLNFMKLWSKNISDSNNTLIEQFTVGNDRDFDLLLAPFDIIGNIAHAKMLASVGLLTSEEANALIGELREIYKTTQPMTPFRGRGFTIDNNIEDIHSQVEFLLTEKLGDVGKKIHSARSRNDQVLLDVKLFLRSEIEKVVNSVQSFFDLLIKKSEEHKEDLLPGYTHLQLAMPSSFGLWFGAYAERPG